MTCRATSLAAALLLALPAAQAQEQPPSALRVCIDPANLPFSNTAGEGIENKIAELFGRRLGLKVEYYAFPQRMGFIRNTLRYRLPGQDYRCDVVLGVPAGYDMVAATQPYYRSTYALVYRKGNGLDAVRSGPDLFALPPAVARKLQIGVYDKSPGATWLAKHGWEDQAKVYAILSPNPEQYPGEIIERDLLQGKIDAAIVWGPIAGFYAKRVKDVELVVVPLKSEPGVRFDYAIAMGVRYGEPKWKATIEKLIADNRSELAAILREYNVPLVDENGEPTR
ncbi:MAG TPA: quinoprotein dehydrogenase-associated putative ABC transporter substrate-binding protein [Burkholderiaceae bacterium]|nr:quinoprotein dehydrogenase-associated putative ABC transporter substrate-binding protein [Burkholderiaceae bacterium]